ncbi:MAG: cation:proton antiporter [Cyanobacteria bacterium J06607_6]
MIAIIEHLKAEPIFTFALLLAIILPVPILFEKLRLPGLVGLLAAGIVFGPHGLTLLDPADPIMELLSDIGLLYLMFVAGLDIDMEQFQKMKYRAAGFGSLTFFIPLLVGTGLARLMGFPWAGAVLIGSLIASHSLLAYPMVSQAGATRNGAVVTTLGATIFTDIGALIVLAICISLGAGDFSLISIVGLLIGLLLYAIAILYGFDQLGRLFFKFSDDNQGNQFLFALLVIFVAAIGAEVIGVEKIVGAFLAGLAVNEVVGNSPVKEKIVFVGTVLFIPIFFVDIGLLIDVAAFFTNPQSIIFAVLLIGGLLVGKFLAAWIAQWLYQYDRAELFTMWGMTLPQVATTLAAALVGNRAGLISEPVLNSVVVMMLVTAIAGPLIVKRAVRDLPTLDDDLEADLSVPVIFDGRAADFSVLVPISNPQTEQSLLGLAATIAQAQAGCIKPLAIAPAQAKMDSPRMRQVITEREALLQGATDIGEQLNIQVEPLLRIDRHVATGISHTAREHHANLIVMGLNERHFNLPTRLFGDLIDKVLWASHCPVAIVRMTAAPQSIQSILIPIKDFSASEVHKVELSMAIARANQADITLLHILPGRPAAQRLRWVSDKLARLAAEAPQDVMITPKVIKHDQVAKAIMAEARHFDLVVTRTRRRRTHGGGLEIGDIPSLLVQQLKCSLILFGEPQS